MKKIVAISFLSIYLLATTQLGQLLKLPAFIEHYNEHKAANTQLTLVDFLIIHYASGNVKDADYEKDMKLPFKTANENVFSITSTVATPPLFSIETEHINFFEKKKQYFRNEYFISNSFFSNIWQPPKTC
ncbi:MAG: hypothetical protein ACOVO1_05195 [Chitinophagaceae bacterium]